MRQAPIWQLIWNCAQQMTSAGRIPFTRQDLIACVQRTDPRISADSINPIIQGITDNLKGGAPGAIGKNILHSVARGRFLLRDDSSVDPQPSEANPFSRKDTHTIVQGLLTPSLPEREADLRDVVIKMLGPLLQGIQLKAEGAVSYRLPSGRSISHASDILALRPGSSRQVSIEIKYRSAVTDQFKARAYDAEHMKREHGGQLLTILLYAKSNTGISIERARDICHQFDRFLGKSADALLQLGGTNELAHEIKRFFEDDE